MMKKAWGRIADRNMEQFEIIDVRSEDEMIESWKDFIHTHHYDYRTSFFDSSLALYPRRTDEAFFCHFLPSSPEEAFVEEKKVPVDFQSFEEMWAWFQPLINVEENLNN